MVQFCAVLGLDRLRHLELLLGGLGVDLQQAGPDQVDDLGAVGGVAGAGRGEGLGLAAGDAEGCRRPTGRRARRGGARPRCRPRREQPASDQREGERDHASHRFVRLMSASSRQRLGEAWCGVRRRRRHVPLHSGERIAPSPARDRNGSSIVHESLPRTPVVTVRSAPPDRVMPLVRCRGRRRSGLPDRGLRSRAVDGLFDVPGAGRLPRARDRCGRGPATRCTRPHRSRCGCVRAPSTSSSGSRSCGPRARRCASSSRATGRCPCCCGARPAPARPPSPPSSASRRSGASSRSPRSRPASRRSAPPSTPPARAGPGRPGDGALRRRGAPLQQGPAGRPAARGGEPLGHPGRGHHREPVLLRHLPAALAQPAAAPGVAHRRRRRRGVDHALADERGLDGAFTLDDDAQAHLVRLAGGDARRVLTYLEAAAGAAAGRDHIDLPTAETAVDQAAVRYDRQGDQHYDVISAFIKSIRGSDADAALHYLARMMEAGEDPRFIARRLVISASEDIGLADPTALTTAVAAAQAVQLIGMPEARLNLAQATIALAVAPKSNAVTTRRRRGQRRRTRRPDRPGAPAPARRALRRGQEDRPRRDVRLPPRRARSAWPSSSTPPRSSRTRPTTAPRRWARRPRSGSGGSGSAASCADDRVGG